MDRGSKVYIAGHRGLVGSAILRRLETLGYGNLLTRTRDELDLMDRQAVDDFFAEERPEYVFLAAAKVGGILAIVIRGSDSPSASATTMLPPGCGRPEGGFCAQK